MNSDNIIEFNCRWECEQNCCLFFVQNDRPKNGSGVKFVIIVENVGGQPI